MLEKKGLASGCTGTSVALVNASSKSPDYYTELSMESARMYRSLESELGEGVDFEGRGNISLVVENSQGMDDARWLVNEQNRVPGMRLELLGPEEARRLAPALGPGIAGAVYCELDGCVNNLKLAAAQARAAARLGAIVQPYTKVTGLTRKNGSIAGVVTDRGPIATDAVICAAGIHTPAIGALADVTIPVLACHGQIVSTEAVPRFLEVPTGPLRQTAWGSVLIGGTNEFVGYSRHTDHQTLASITARALRIFPGLGHLRATRFWAGLRPWPPDGLPILGAVPGAGGLYVAAAHSGITLAPVVGRLMAELVTEGKTSIDIERYSMRRFARYVRHVAPLDRFRRFWAEHQDRVWMA